MDNQHWHFMGTQTLTEYDFDLRYCFADDLLRFDNLMVDGDEMHDEDLTSRQFAEIIGHLKEYEYELL